VKRMIALSISIVIAMSLATSAAAGRKPARQSVEGTITLATPTPDDVCFSGLQRRARLTSQMAFPNGLVGFDFDVDPKTVGKRFKLEVTEGAGADLDINFYAGLGTLEDPATNPAVVAFEERKEGGEVGVVPKGYSKVIICAYAGNNVSFTYTASTR
jgi:opacity protein-like surface antigen